MHASCTYHIRVREQVYESDINAMGPIEMQTVRVDTDATQFTIRSDQSGLIGLLRHLHGKGFVLISVTRE